MHPAATGDSAQTERLRAYVVPREAERGCRELLGRQSRLESSVEKKKKKPGTVKIAFWKDGTGDTDNDRGSLQGGIAALDAYLAADSAGWYKNEAIVLRRTALVAQRVSPGATGASNGTSTTASGSTSATGATDTVVVVSRPRDEEIASLKEQLAKSKEELAKVSAELERIKKRLANPSN